MAVQVSKRYVLGDYNLEPEKRLLYAGEDSVHLANGPFQVLLYLIENRDRVVTRNELLDRFWDGKDVYDDSVRKCIGAIRKALNDRSENPRFIETHYAEGYRYIGPAEEQLIQSEPFVVEIERTRGVKIVVEEEEIQVAASEIDQVPASSQPVSLSAVRQFRHVGTVLVALAIIALVAFALVFLQHNRANSSQPSSLRSIAVLPLKNLTGDPAQDYFSDGMTESLITELSRVNGLKVMSRATAFTFKDRELDAREIGNRLGVASVLEGSVRGNGDNVRVEVRLVSTEDGRVLWASDSFDRTLKDIFAIQDGIACSVVAELRVRLCGEGEPLKRHTNNVEAYQAYLKGRYFINNQYVDLRTGGPEKTLKKAAGYFEQAIQIDPNYAPAYAGLADAYTQVVWFLSEDPNPVIAQAKAAALKAIELDSSMGETHTALASAYVLEWDFDASAREYERAVSLNTSYAEAHHQYSMYFMTVGRVDDMLAEMKRAEELDPLNLYIIADRGAGFYLARRYDEAIAQFRKWHDISQTYGPDINIGMCYLGKGMYDEAVKELQEVLTVSGRTPETVTWLAVGYAMAGNREAAERLLNEVKQVSKKQYVPETFFAYIYTALGQKEQAFGMLDRAYREHDSTLLALKTHPWIDPLRSDPRYQDLLRRVGLPQS